MSIIIETDIIVENIVEWLKRKLIICFSLFAMMCIVV